MTDPQPRPTGLRRRAEELSAPLPALLVAAEHLAATVQLGEHGRRRAGIGDEFWQYRPAHAGDEARMIDWRRSARADQHFVREREWQSAQSVQLWVDSGRSMGFSGDAGRAAKSDRARLLALALAVLMIRAGERVGLTGPLAPPRAGEVQLMRLATVFATGEDGDEDFGSPAGLAFLPLARGVMISDFLGDLGAVEAALAEASDHGVTGTILQVLDPVEEAFPFEGRTIFESMAGLMRHETRKAGDLRTRYLERLAERKDRLSALARAAGWQYEVHHTDAAPAQALLWLWHAMERGR